MQDNKNQETPKPRAMVMLENGLNELATQLMDGDCGRIANKVSVAQRTVIRYVKEGYVGDFETGKKILEAGRAIVIDRERSIKKHVA